jgi:hypothetical protein
MFASTPFTRDRISTRRVHCIDGITVKNLVKYLVLQSWEVLHIDRRAYCSVQQVYSSARPWNTRRLSRTAYYPSRLPDFRFPGYAASPLVSQN